MSLLPFELSPTREQEFSERVRDIYYNYGVESLQKLVVIAIKYNCPESAKYIVKLLDDRKVNVYMDLVEFHKAVKQLLLDPDSGTKDTTYAAIVKGMNVTAKEVFLNTGCNAEPLVRLLGDHYSKDAFGLPKDGIKVSSGIVNIVSKMLKSNNIS